MKTAIVLAVAAALLAGPALSQPGRGNPNGVPPGLAKKPGGLPPGQANKIYARGEYLPMSYIDQRYYMNDYVRYGLQPAPPGYRWVRVEDNAYLTQTTTGLIANVILNLLSR
jgi:hypothetical protein